MSCVECEQRLLAARALGKIGYVQCGACSTASTMRPPPMDCDDVQAAKLELYEEALRNIARGDDGASCHPDTAREALEAAAKI